MSSDVTEGSGRKNGVVIQMGNVDPTVISWGPNLEGGGGRMKGERVIG